ncbi:HAD-IA family hydrolase [Streptomyces sp. NBC_01235]|uniref:HAD-IA family hydrolase n=1 Tax=Streptomyces sp. NBC_01235 TaxID=2903788 RepID=UPI002E0F76A3|nr:HAD-IA family hydrolase [Streptomyces sp. NBC_01235]
MAAVAGADFDAFWKSYWAERQQYDAGDIPLNEYWKRVAAGIGTDWTPGLATALDTLDVESWLCPNRETLQVVEKLRSSGIRLAVLSNAPLSLASALHELPWLESFERIICSSEIRSTKPDPRCYLTALDILGAYPHQVAFVDDRAVNVTSAQSLGIQSHLFTDAGALRRDLHHLLAV